MSYQVSTPILSRVALKMSALMDNLEIGAIETAVAGKMIGAGNTICRTVSTDLRVRLSAKALSEAEAPQAQAA